MLDFRLLETVVSALSEAREGDEALDVRVSIALGELQSGSAKLLRLFAEEGYDWNVISSLLDQQVPPYTTSLDAAVPGETIVGVLFSRKRGRWAAIHRGADGREEGPLWASTEALARRAAGLAGLLAQEGRDGLAEAPQGAESGGDSEAGSRKDGSRKDGGAGSQDDPEDDKGDDLPDWKILF